MIDTPLPPLDREIPSDLNHLHFGRAQTEAEITLSPGEHTLQLLLGDHEHLPHDPPVFSKVVRVRVVDAPSGQAAQAGRPAGRQPSPPDAAVYFIYPRDREGIYPNSTIRFGLRNMGVAPAGVSRPNTGHHHLLVDVATPPLDQPLPSDLNHIHFGNGQTEERSRFRRDEHTLQLILADDQHVPHDPPVMSERIKVIVKVVRKKPRQGEMMAIRHQAGSIAKALVVLAAGGAASRVIGDGCGADGHATGVSAPGAAPVYFHYPIDGIRVPERFTVQVSA